SPEDAIYNPRFPAQNFTGVANIQKLFQFLFPPEVITQNAVNTESITLLAPFDEQGAAGTATGVVYTTITFVGQGNFTGQALALLAKFEDKYVKTGDFTRYGGWRISERFIFSFVSCPPAERMETWMVDSVSTVHLENNLPTRFIRGPLATSTFFRFRYGLSFSPE
ncbi:hypothetical protein MMC07_008268, partial [Pseudocyphellaria aurata]|nr:hypothetical protein [Pseudocyphellaria aurata]